MEAPLPDGSLFLPAADAVLHGGCSLSNSRDGLYLGSWTAPTDTASWTVEAPRDGAYTVALDYACREDAARGTFRVAVDNASGHPETPKENQGRTALDGVVRDTSNWNEFMRETVPGRLQIPAGRHVIRLQPILMPHLALMNLRGIVLKPSPVLPAAPAADGSITLWAGDVPIVGRTFRMQILNGIPNIGWWSDPADTAEWKVEVPRAAAYQVQIEYSCLDGSAGSTYHLSVDGSDQTVQGTVANTGGWVEFKTETLPGTLPLAAGRRLIRLTADTVPNGAIMNLRRVILRPANT